MTELVHPNDEAAKTLDYPFKFLSGNNTLYHLVCTLNDEADKEVYVDITRQEIKKILKVTEKIRGWKDEHEYRIIDIVANQRNKFTQKSDSWFNSVIKEWLYVSFSEGEPFKRCVCGDITRYNHKIKHVKGKVLYLGSCCVEICYGTEIYVIAKSVENLVENVSEPLGYSLIEFVYNLNFINEEENKLLRSELKLFQSDSYGLNYQNLDFITQVTAVKARIGLMIIQGFAQQKFLQNIKTLYNEMITVAWGETDVLNEREMDFIKASYWFSRNTAKHSKAVIDIADRRIRNLKLTSPQQVCWEMYLKNEASDAAMCTEEPEFILLKEKFMAQKVLDITNVVENLKTQSKQTKIPIITHEQYTEAIDKRFEEISNETESFEEKERILEAIKSMKRDVEAEESKDKKDKKDNTNKQSKISKNDGKPKSKDNDTKIKSNNKNKEQKNTQPSIKDVIQKPKESAKKQEPIKLTTEQQKVNKIIQDGLGSNITQTRLNFEKKKPTQPGFIVVRGCEPLFDISESTPEPAKVEAKKDEKKEEKKEEETPFNFVNPSILKMFGKGDSSQNEQPINDTKIEEKQSTSQGMDIDVLIHELKTNDNLSSKDNTKPLAKKQRKREFIPDDDIDYDFTKSDKKVKNGDPVINLTETKTKPNSNTVQLVPCDELDDIDDQDLIDALNKVESQKYS